ncbi:phage tail-collar fiber domain-containing protein [Citrobacter freundii]|uniref:phage tail-collar fiber domain-containing protein n=1 Tax=Citrobacter freundii TaxID=546 RepID=UPI00122FC801|nr:phage tail protein [Citrobacter freundii]KAA3567223.1 phage tail protein [Citrobacter freundii]
MSQAVITKVFSEWKAQQAINNQPVTLDEFIFAYIPGLDADKPIDNTETTPAADKIVYRQAVSKSGVVNENSVVYSVTLGADVGDFDFNWIGLANKATGTLAMIIHAPTQRKIKNANGQQGNVLVRSMLMEYSGAREATEITTPAETWQIDFTARLAAMDERQRRENIDLYGAAAFFDSGYLVAKSGNQFFVTKGAGYVAGLRAELPADLNINAAAKPTKVWLDVSWTGTLTSEWAVQSKITVAADLADYVLGGVQHYVFAVASIDAAGNITDLRPKGTLNDQAASDALKKHEQSRNHPDATTSEKGFTRLSSATDSTSEELAATSKAVKIAMDNANARLAKDRNGSDIPNPALFVQNIGLQDTVNKAAGALQKDQNLNDIPDKAKARTALKLGTAATLDVTASATDSTPGHVLKVGDRGFGLGALQIIEGFDFGTYQFAAGETLLIYVLSAKNVPPGMMSPSGWVYIHVTGVRNVFNDVSIQVTDYQTGNTTFFVSVSDSNNPRTWYKGGLLVGGISSSQVQIDNVDRVEGNALIHHYESSGKLVMNYGYYRDGFSINFYDVNGAWQSNPFFVGRNGNASVSGNLSGGRVYEGGVRVYSPNNPQPVSFEGYATQNWVLQNFVQNIDLTAPFEAELWDGRGYLRPTDGAAMYNLQMVGGSSNVGKFILRYTRRLVNNVWYVLN